MKKLICILTIIFSVSFLANAQKQYNYAILELSEVGPGSYGKQGLIIYYGTEEQEDFGANNNIKFSKYIGTNTAFVVKAFNYLAGKGYEYVNSNATVVSTSSVVSNYIFRKEN